MTTDHQMAPILRSWLHDTTTTPPDARQSVAEVMTRLPQADKRRHWWLLTRRTPAPSIPSRPYQPVPIPATNGHSPTATGRFQSMFSVTKFVVAGVLVALFGGFLLAGTLAPRGDDAVLLPGASSSTVPVPSETAVEANTSVAERNTNLRLSTDLPDGVPSGSIPAGDELVRWVHLTSDFGPMPNEGHVLATADGLAVHDRREGTLMATDDGVSWVAVPSPTGSWHGRVTELDGVYWFIVPESGQVWRSSDLVDWQELDTTVIRDAIPMGWNAVGTEVRGPVTINDQISFWISYTYRLPRQTLGITERGASLMQQIGENHYWLCVSKKACREKKPVRDLSFKQTKGGMLVIDRPSGKQLGVLEGANAELLYEGRTGTSGQSYSVAGGAVALSPHPRPADPIEFLLRMRAPEGLPEGTYAVPLGSRWFASELEPGHGDYSDRETGQRWIHAGGDWVPLADLGLPESGLSMSDPSAASPQGVAAPGKTGLRDTALLWYEAGDTRHLWVLTVEPAA